MNPTQKAILPKSRSVNSNSLSVVTRREFLKTSLAAAAGTSFFIAGTKSSGRVLGANDTIRIGVTGVNSRGAGHVSELCQMKNVQVTYLIDPDVKTYDKNIKTIENHGGRRPKTVKDVRQALEDKELDAISIATPNHWHSLITIWGCQAGKDVYVEKPCSHNVREGRIAVETAAKHNRIVQHGTQMRAIQGFQKLAAVIASGKLGKLLVSRGLCYKPRGSIGFQPVSLPPPELDFNIWLGPAPEQPFHRNLVHYNWHYFWDFGNGDIGNQGVHQMDIARWMIPGATLPKSVMCVGGRLGYEDQGQAANTQVAVFDYGETQLIFEVRGLETVKYLGQGIGNVMHLEGGTIVGTFPNPTFFPKGSDQPAPLPEVEVAEDPGGGHFGNFFAAMRSRNAKDLRAPILEGHYSSALCHLANISYRLGEKVPFDSKGMPFGGNKEGAETFERMKEHLMANRLKLEETSYQLGRNLKFDARTEKFVDDSQADKMLTRQYRAPFVVPEKVA